MKKKILGKPGIYVEDFTSIYSLGENIGYNRYVCTEKATGIKYSCLRLEKKYFDNDNNDDDDDDDDDNDYDDDDDEDVVDILRERLRRGVEIGEHMMKSKKQQYYPSNNNNSNILESKAAYVDNYYVYLVMELLSGDRLDEWIKAKGKELDDEEAAYLFWQVLNAIHAFHSMEVMLRTLDLSHFWFLPEYKEKLHIKYEIDLDAIFINEGNLYDSLVSDTSYKYKAPEMKNNRYGKEIDIWAAGAILYRLLTRRNLEREATDDQNDLDDWINKELSGKSDAAKDLLKKMLKLDPKQRIAAAEALEHPWLKFVSETVPDFKQFVKLRTFSLTFSSMVEVLAKSLPEKENQRLKQLLNNMDTYASTVTLEELKLRLSPLSSTLSESQMKELNDAVDYFFTFPGVTKIMHRHQLEHANIHKAFQFFDIDGDGFITRDDLGQAMSPYRIGGEAAINEIIDDVDINKDGKINYSEFEAMIKEEMHEYNEKQRKLKF